MAQFGQRSQTDKQWAVSEAESIAERLVENIEDRLFRNTGQPMFSEEEWEYVYETFRDDIDDMIENCIEATLMAARAKIERRGE